MKIKIFCASEDNINRVKKHPMDWEKIFANYLSGKGLISKVYKKLLKLNNKNT